MAHFERVESYATAVFHRRRDEHLVCQCRFPATGRRGNDEQIAPVEVEHAVHSDYARLDNLAVRLAAAKLLHDFNDRFLYGLAFRLLYQQASERAVRLMREVFRRFRVRVGSGGKMSAHADNLPHQMLFAQNV